MPGGRKRCGEPARSPTKKDDIGAGPELADPELVGRTTKHGRSLARSPTSPCDSGPTRVRALFGEGRGKMAASGGRLCRCAHVREGWPPYRGTSWLSKASAWEANMTIEEERAARVLEDKSGATLGMDGGAMGGGRGGGRTPEESEGQVEWKGQPNHLGCPSHAQVQPLEQWALWHREQRKLPQPRDVRRAAR